VSDLREQIRSLLREELAALRVAAPPCAREAVRIENDSDLLHFARDLLARAQDPGFVADVHAGRVRFALERRTYPEPAHTAFTLSSAPVPSACLDKALITEKDVAVLGSGARVLRIAKHCCLTPLAKDEARRRGIKIERNPA